MNVNTKIRTAFLVVFFSVIAASGCDDTEKITFLPVSGVAGPEAGDKIGYNIKSGNIMMIYVSPKRYGDGLDDYDMVEVSHGFWIGETEVTYAVWRYVRVWASTRITDPYFFATLGIEGHNGGSDALPLTTEPVTSINWRTCMVWCNALTEWHNDEYGTHYTCAYRAGNVPIRDARDSNGGQCDTAVQDLSATGFRLLTAAEWELAARYINDANNDGDIYDPGEYCPGTYASGAIANVGNVVANEAVAWYDENSGSSTHNVKELAPNALGIYDMNGNVSEFCFDLSSSLLQRVSRGGSWGSTYQSIELGRIGYSNPDIESTAIGFRLAKSGL